MKHIGWCLDRIQITMAHMPRSLPDENAKIVANSTLDEVEEYAQTLAQIILNPKFKGYLNKLEKSSIEGVKLQADEIEELLKDLEHMLQVLDYYIKELKDIIKNYPEQWSKKADQIVLMIDQKFGGERGELRDEFKVALHEINKLKEIVTSEKHLMEFLKIS